MTILQIILAATHILMIAMGYQMGKQDGIQIGRADMYKANR
jgi:hypothetical protein